MAKINRLTLLFVLGVTLLTGSSCRTVEVALPETTVRIQLKGDLTNTDIVPVNDGVQVELKAPGDYAIKTPTMGGGYSELAFLVRYNRHEPLTYKVIALRKSKTVLREFSLGEIYALPRTGEIYLLSVAP
ncbi:MAG: hypothetical protein JNM27_05955 [Leptospirales bacterium]|nr:hypothetical protein [Leptospirales bacterium]